MSYDRADWHSGGDFPSGLPQEAGATHIGMFLAWAINSGLAGELHRTEVPEGLDAVRTRKMTGRDFLLQYCDEKFTDEDLSDEGNAFAAEYYATEGDSGRYLVDYEKVFKEQPSVYAVADTWANYDRIAPIITRRFQEWKHGPSRKWWQFWKS